MKPLPSTAIKENRDGRAWDGRTIEEPPALTRATWLSRVLIAALVIAITFATCRTI